MPVVSINGQSVEVAVGATLFAAVDHVAGATEEIASSCDRAGTCGECLVVVRRGSEGLSPPDGFERFLTAEGTDEDGVYRLACRARVLREDTVIEVETLKRQLRIAEQGRPADIADDPWIRRVDGWVEADGRRLFKHAGAMLGVGVDVGTTTVVLHVVDLASRATVAVRSFENPQRFAGSDVMHRVTYDSRHPGVLQHSLIARLNAALRDTALPPESLVAVAVAGNPTMRDLCFGLDVAGLGHKPYVSLTQRAFAAGESPTTALRRSGEALGLAVHPQALIYGLPVIASHVGADMAAVLATLPSHTSDSPMMVVDIGTNTEVVAAAGGRWVCASCPAGPAFEGGGIGCGMAAADGAITHLQRREGAWRIEQIGSCPPRGLCGSGLVDALGQLVLSGEMDGLGRFADGAGAVAIDPAGKVKLTRSDASKLAQAKAANGVGQLLLLRRLGLVPADLGTYYLAGAFANHLDLDHARRIGLILPLPNERIVRIGNASVEGAKAALLSRSARDRIEALVQRIEHVELEQESDFFDLFVEMHQLEPIGG